MAKKTRRKTTADDFIKAVMTSSSTQEAASKLGCSRQAVSKRLQQYKDRGVKGLPDFDARSVDLGGVQSLVDRYRKGKA